MQTAIPQLLEGDEAFDLLNNAGFNAQWKSLCQVCPWSTANQRPEFAIPWYQTYSSRFQPVLVHRPPNGLDPGGLLTLALDQEAGTLAVAGAHQIDYAAWICQPEQVNTFATDSLRLLARRFQGQTLRLRYLAPGHPVDWINESNAWSGRISCKSFDRPVLRLDRPASLEKALRKKSNKSRYSRLRRIGTVQVQKLETRADLDRWLNEISAYCDLRQGAINGSYPFLNDKHKRAFHLAMMERDGLLYCTVMLVDNKLAAALINLCSGQSAAVGLFAISPFLTKHSPGKLLVYETALRLASEGFKDFDLTPGGDWKDRFANHTDEVLMADIHFGLGRARLASAKSFGEAASKASLKLVGVEAKRARELSSIFAKVRLADAITKISGARAWTWSNSETRIYSLRTADVGQRLPDAAISLDCPEDLLAFKASRGSDSRSQFLAAALRNLARGLHLFSSVEKGELVFYAWLAEYELIRNESAFDLQYTYPQGSAMVTEIYSASGAGGSELDRVSLGAVVRVAAMIESCERVYVSDYARGERFRRALSELGFEHEASLHKQVRFGRVRVSCVKTEQSTPGST